MLFAAGRTSFGTFPSQYLERVTTWEYMQFFPPSSPLPSFGRDYCDILIYKLLFSDLQLWCQFTIGALHLQYIWISHCSTTTLTCEDVWCWGPRWRLLMWARAWQMSWRLLSVISGKVELLFLLLLRFWFLQSRLMCVGVSSTLLGFTHARMLPPTSLPAFCHVVAMGKACCTTFCKQLFNVSVQTKHLAGSKTRTGSVGTSTEDSSSQPLKLLFSRCWLLNWPLLHLGDVQEFNK